MPPAGKSCDERTNRSEDMRYQWLLVLFYGLILAIASLLPSGTGPLNGWDASLSPSLQNLLHFPAYCKQFDVGLIPFKINELTLAVNPIKLREYLAAGLPVVSTPMPEVQVYEHLIEIAETHEQTIKAIDTTLSTPSTARTERTTAMAAETWPEKVEGIAERLRLA